MDLNSKPESWEQLTGVFRTRFVITLGQNDRQKWAKIKQVAGVSIDDAK